MGADGFCAECLPDSGEIFGCVADGVCVPTECGADPVEHGWPLLMFLMASRRAVSRMVSLIMLLMEYALVVKAARLAIRAA